ncbi:hypothetical protein GCM10023324_14560 [Streptomyces youssoufiensis]
MLTRCVAKNDRQWRVRHATLSDRTTPTPPRPHGVRAPPRTPTDRPRAPPRRPARGGLTGTACPSLPRRPAATRPPPDRRGDPELARDRAREAGWRRPGCGGNAAKKRRKVAYLVLMG